MYNFWLNVLLFVVGWTLIYLYHYMLDKSYNLGKVLAWFYSRDSEDIFHALGIFIIILNFGYFLINCMALNYSRRFEATYDKKKAFMEYNSENEYESVMFRDKKLELNEELFNYQWRFETRPNWTFATEKIMELEPIK